MPFKIILENGRITDSIEHAERILNSVGFKIENRLEYYIASGMNGDAFKVKGTNKVLKISKGDEVRKASKIVKQRFENVCTHYFAREFDYDGSVRGTLAVIVMEFLKPLPFSEHNNGVSAFFRGLRTFNVKGLPDMPIHDFMKETFTGEPISPRTKEQMYDIIKSTKPMLKDKNMFNLFLYSIVEARKHVSEAGYVDLLKILKEHEHFAHHVINGLFELKTVGITFGDLHGGNVLYSDKDNKFKLIDIS